MLVALVAIVTALTAPPARPESPPRSEGVKLAATCFFNREVTSGMNKICYYDCLGGEVAITISSVKLCPLSIQR